jgi:hypothetical protein
MYRSGVHLAEHVSVGLKVVPKHSITSFRLDSEHTGIKAAAAFTQLDHLAHAKRMQATASFKNERLNDSFGNLAK